MADRNLVTYLEETLNEQPPGLTGYKIEIERSAAGQPGVLITITNALDEPETIVVKDALALFGPVLEWLLQDEELVGAVVQRAARDRGGLAEVMEGMVRAHIASLLAVALERTAADTTDDGSPVQ